MKKNVNLLLLLLVVLCGTFMIGANKVKAALNASPITIVCDPAAIEVDHNAQCYIVSKITNEADGTGFKGFHFEYFLSHLTLVSAYGGEYGADNGNKIAAHYDKYLNGAKQDDITCKINETADGAGCLNLIAENTTTGIVSKPSTNSALTKQSAEYTVLGTLIVKLNSTAINGNAKHCGEICMTGMGFKLTSAMDDSVIADDAEDFNFPKKTCSELTPQGTPENSETGAFASYAVLLAGAFIAISAIMIAKKNNRFYRV